MSPDPRGNANPIPFVKLGLKWRNESPKSKRVWLVMGQKSGVGADRGSEQTKEDEQWRNEGAEPLGRVYWPSEPGAWVWS